MVHKKRRHFLAQFSMPFHMVWSVLLQVVAHKTTFFGSQSEASNQWFLKLPLATKRSTPCEKVWKTVPENGVFSCVPFYLRSLGRFCKMWIKDALHWSPLFSKEKLHAHEYDKPLNRVGEIGENHMSLDFLFVPSSLSYDPSRKGKFWGF